VYPGVVRIHPYPCANRFAGVNPRKQGWINLSVTFLWRPSPVQVGNFAGQRWPWQELATVQREHLTGHRRRVE